ncbi:MAG: DUF2851 family protein [Bacteroidota bacterium]
MREDLLHYIWKNQKFLKLTLQTSSKEVLEVIDAGHYNTSSGPDFFNARIRIGAQEWAGNLEVHVKSSDWYVHGHEKDIHYDNVILHVVWEDDAAIFRKDGTEIPTLPLKHYVSANLLTSYKGLLHNKKRKFINCERDVSSVDDIILHQWQERLFVERLEQKSLLVESLLRKTKNDWEMVLFKLLMKSFGLDKNGGAFLSMAEHLDGKVLRKISKDTMHMESLFYGIAGFLNQENILDGYFLRLKGEFDFLQNKFQIKKYIGEKPIFFGLRPPNFPTIRLSQLANVYGRCPNLFGRLMDAKNSDDFFTLFDVEASPYWDTHYTFGKASKNNKKKLTKDFINLILINAVIPLRFSFSRYLGRNQINQLMDLMNQLKAERNTIITGFQTLGISSMSAFESQAKIQLYKKYCRKNRCLQCHVGANLLGRKG